MNIQVKALCQYFHIVLFNLFFKILQDEISKFGRNSLLAKFGSERVKL